MNFTFKMKGITYFLVFITFFDYGHSISAKLSVNLQKTGFHRILKYTTVFTEAPVKTQCDYFLEQTLPASVYISTDQLDSLQRLNKINCITPTTVDIETITEKSEPFKVYLYGDTASLFTINLPIHFRYHMPGNTSFVRVSIDRPKLFVNCGAARIQTLLATNSSGQLNNLIKFRCKNSDKSICRWQQLDYDLFTNDIKVSIPIGYKDFNSIVVFVTLLVSWVASYYTIVAISEKSIALNKRM